MIPSASREVGEGARRRRQVVLDSRDDKDGGRIRWLFSSCCYQVWYKDKDGRVHQSTKGLMVSRDDSFGQPLKKEAFQRAKDLALHKARTLWIVCDQSTAYRYDEIIPRECR